ncbi:MAG: hypothetical protein KDD25_00515 [Bdellovibrionales bacterium]|nr:hypothetical protein [Bdellovibrionales bacterium]
MEHIVSFVSKATGLKSEKRDETETHVSQTTDGKGISVHCTDLKEVIVREDSLGKEFIQVNFLDGRKILFTDTLIGFKPQATPGLDLSHLPRVVTTPDLLSVFEATEEAISTNAPHSEIETLKSVFQAILTGGENIGFDLSEEKNWFVRLTSFRGSA